MGLGQLYCRQLRRNLTGLHANFPPNRPIALGDYGVARDDVFQRLGNIAQLGVTFRAIDGVSQSTYQFKSTGAVDVDFVAKGDVTPGGVPALRAGLEIRFNRQDAVFFNAAGCVVSQVDDVSGVGQALVTLLREGRWDSEFLVVTSVVRAAHTTAIASADRSSEIKLEAASDALQAIDLADATVRLQTKRSRSTALEIVTASDQSPLMQLSRIRGLFRPEFRPEAAMLEAQPEPFVFASVELDSTLSPLADSATESAAESADAADADVSVGAEFRPEAVRSDFEVDRAIQAYIPLLNACYALAEQQPIAFPAGYEPIAEIRVATTEVAEVMAADSVAVQEAVETDFAAAEAGVLDPSAFGFVVRETATGSVLVCIRGTRTPREWLENFTAVPNPFDLVPGFGLVHLGFERMYRSVRTSIQQGLAGVSSGTRITVVGHSLGGAMSTLAAVDIKLNFSRANTDLCTFGGPRTGKTAFRRNFNREITRCFRITNQFDVVPHVPSLITGWNHVGEEIEVDGDVDHPHSLSAYLQGLRNLGQPRELAMGVISEAFAVSEVLSVRMP
jgi:triacylglycerol lipase